MIQFKAKVKTARVGTSDVERAYVEIPTFTRSHCDMGAFRKHPNYGAYANSDLFPAMLGRIKAEVFGSASCIWLDSIPQGVNVDRSKFLAVVTVGSDAVG